ncbi:MAG: HNH endonuclease [Pedosphaera sp.]|nr:HNH endonuclease [Pedosphaera sp.]
MSATLRLAVRKRAAARSEYCRLPDLVPHLMRFHLEHIRARRHGGPSSLNNLAWACARCNERKGTNLSGVDPDTNRVVRLFNPRRDAWTRHFAWDGLRIRGLTTMGRATAWLLEFNSDERLTLRQGLRMLGLI